jgi:hypothetical protein
LQAAISASHAAYTTGGQESRLYIPTPDASQTIDLKEFHRLYKTPFNNPSSFVRFSATVEDSIGCPYMMDEADDEWLATFNKSHPKLSLSEDAFESIMWRIESVSLEKVPYLETVSPMFTSCGNAFVLVYVNALASSSVFSLAFGNPIRI